MNYYREKNKPINFQDVAFYFDGVASIRQDQGGVGKRTAEILNLRERLLSLPEHEFNTIIKTLHRMVDNSSAKRDTNHMDKQMIANEKMSQANMLYDAVNESFDAQSTVAPVSPI